MARAPMYAAADMSFNCAEVSRMRIFLRDTPMQASGPDVFDGDLELVPGSEGSDVESLMCLLRTQVKRAGVNTLIAAAGRDAASGGAVQAVVTGAGVAQAAAAAAVEDAPEHDGGVESQSLEVLMRQLANAFEREADYKQRHATPTITMTTRQYTYDYDQQGVKCRHSEEDGWEPLEPNCLNCGYKTEECECGEYEEGWYAGASGSHLQSQLLHVDIEGGGEGGLHDALLAIDQMCEDLSARKLP